MYATQLNPNQLNQSCTASPVRARERQIRAPQKRILGARSMGSYWDNVTVYPDNGYITGTNPVVRRVMSLTWAPERMCANQCTTKHAMARGAPVARAPLSSTG